MSVSTVYGTILQILDRSVKFAINDDGDDIIFIPRSVISESETDIDDGFLDADPENMLVQTWWYDKNKGRFE